MKPTDFPPDLQHEVAARAPQPGFDAVMDRADAHRRRRRTTIASGLAAAVVVAGTAAVLGGVVGDDGRSPQPATPAPSPWDGTSAPDERLPSDVVAVVDDDRLQLWSITGGDDGAVAAIWRGCDFDPCRFAVVIRDGDSVFGQALNASYPEIAPVPGGFLVQDALGTTRLSASGDRAEIFDTGPGAGDVMAGDAAVRVADGWRLLRGDKLVPIPQPPSSTDVLGAHVTEEGRLVVASYNGAGISVAATDDGRSWDSTLPRTTEAVRMAVVAGSGNHVAVVLLGDAPDGSLPVVDVLLSRDAGATWTTAVNLDTEGGDRLTDMSALAVGTDGTTYLTTGSHHLVRIDDEGFATPIQLSAFESGVFRSGDDVCVVAERGRYDALLCSADGLTGWEDRPLPGLG